MNRRFGRFFWRALQGCALIVAGIVSAIVVGWYVEHENSPWLPSGRWVGWAFITSILAYAIFTEYRGRWRSARFCFVLITLFALHTLGYVILFRFVTELRAFWVGALVSLELYVSFGVLNWFDPQSEEGSDATRPNAPTFDRGSEHEPPDVASKE